MLRVLKAACVATYALTLATAVGVLPAGLAWIGHPLNIIVLTMLAIHAIELIFAFRHVRRHPGSLATSILLTILFGVLHWKPLADQHARARAGSQA